MISPFESNLGFMDVLFSPHPQVDLTSSMSSANSKSLFDAGNSLDLKSVLSP